MGQKVCKSFKSKNEMTDEMIVAPGTTVETSKKKHLAKIARQFNDAIY